MRLRFDRVLGRFANPAAAAAAGIVCIFQELSLLPDLPIADDVSISSPPTRFADVRTELGARFDDPTLIFGKPLILLGRAAWAHDFVGNPALSATFQALPGATFTVNGAQIVHYSALTTAGAQLYLTPRWTLLAKFEGEFAPGSQTYAGTGTLRYTW